MKRRITIIVLAAGAASRMGNIKQLLPWKNTTVLEHVLKTARASAASNLVLVTGANAKIIEREITISKEIAVVFNEHWSSGLGSSIACGAKYAIAKDPACEAIMVVLADQPLIDTDYLNNLIAIYKQENFPIVASRYNNGPGVPAIFHNTYFKALIRLDKDNGAKRLMIENKLDTFLLDPGGKAQDLDTPEDFARLQKGIGKEE